MIFDNRKPIYFKLQQQMFYIIYKHDHHNNSARASKANISLQKQLIGHQWACHTEA